MNETPDGAVLSAVAELSDLALRTYRINPALVEEHANGERRITQGGYGDRQLFEVVQNAADELQQHAGGRIEVVLTESHLYCANEGTPITPQGAETILRMGVSRKRGGQIGRFGVGVKSVLSVTDTPQFFGVTGSFGFDAAWSAREILAAVNAGRADRGEPPLTTEQLGDTPVLRLARPLDEAAERAADPVLDSLMRWATTVVRLPLLPGAVHKLSADLHRPRQQGEDKEFPRLFQLFSHHVGTLRLEDRSVVPNVIREITVRHNGTRHVISESRRGQRATSEEWRVFSIPHQVTDNARGNAGELHDRVTIDVSWAVPAYSVADSGARLVPPARGTFWSYFPTKYPTTLSGALNAAWKTNEDRQNLLDGSSLNRELLDVAAKLIVGSLDELVVAEDPGAYLPLLPGRAKESPNWACEYLTKRVWATAACNPSLPDQRGELRAPQELRIHPAGTSSRAMELWRSYEGRPTDWVHHSVDYDRTRRGKVGHILEAAGIEAGGASVREWLEALVEDGTAEASAAAIRLLAHLLDNDLRPVDEEHRQASEDARKARIVLTESHGMVAPIAGKVFRRTAEDGLRDDLVYVASALSDDPALLSALDRIGIRDADAQGRFLSVLDQGFQGYTDESWTRFWELLRSAGGAGQLHRIRDRVPDPDRRLCCRTREGSFRPLRNCLRPGPVVPADGSRDASVAVDARFHADDMTILRDLGVLDRPVRNDDPSEDDWFAEYHAAVYRQYKHSAGNARIVTEKNLAVEGGPVGGPIRLFLELSEAGRAAFLRELPTESISKFWQRQEGKRAASRTPVMSPIRWALLKWGYAQTSQGLRPLRDAVGPQLSPYADVLPVADLEPDKAAILGLPTSEAEVPAERWTALLDQIKQSEDDAFIGRSYALLIRVGYDFSEEATVRCRVGDHWEERPDGEAAVAVSRAEFDELVAERHPALLLDRPQDAEQAEFMIEEWGMNRVAEVIEKRLRFVAVGEPVPVTDLFPPLRQRLGSRVGTYSVQNCSELEEIVRTPNLATSRSEPLDSVRQDNTLLIVGAGRDLDTLIAADREFGWGLGASGCRDLLRLHEQQLADQELRRRIAAIRTTPDVVDKLVLLLSPEDLRLGLPEGLVDSEIAETGCEPDHRRLAEMAVNAHGESVLRHHAKDLRRTLPNVPDRFNGGHTALKFVADLGFDDAFAGFSIPSPPTREEIPAPTEYPALHDYQERLASDLYRMLCSRTPQRAMLSLPTGGGKTRVACEGVIRWVHASGAPEGPIVWIAQTDELCEQAVQSWKFVWSKVGAGENLVIDRLWSTNAATPITGRPHLVVATDAKLRSCLDTDEYAWLRKASLVIVDEAHVAIAPQYTRILELFGLSLTRNQTRCHLVGLTATPFRNDSDLTDRLVKRFGNRRLDEGLFGDDEPIHALQRLGVLSRVEHRQLPGTKVALTENELRNLEQFGGLLPKTAELRIAADQARNELLLDEIAKMPDDWPILVFATSVSHAKVLAAKLRDRGITAGAIDSATLPAERRRIVDEFRKERIRVITNYGVLSQGFDAPATRAVVIARPVYSANVYQQMIGRGLRGKRNGGKDDCLILDVRDNIVNFDGKLAFTAFEHLWQENAR
ncbi:DEAD/DEAH box helicase [Streptomyces sp. Ru72]|uniref:DEAD/DEAH box helicase n=1 Tax=Streptomyces sp. Ru72 TaxID=2080747 RepID=UPI000CDD0D10|nr:DEAD/DEAH box helicase [Streptomyces sp. Ru72]POX44207.1 helicase [Streptomyces sp. Ru72]